MCIHIFNKNYYAIFILLMFLFGCSENPDLQKFEQAKLENTESAYKSYLEEFPTGDFVLKAESAIVYLYLVENFIRALKNEKDKQYQLSVEYYKKIQSNLSTLKENLKDEYEIKISDLSYEESLENYSFKVSDMLLNLDTNLKNKIKFLSNKSKGLIYFQDKWITAKEKFDIDQIAKGLVLYQGKWITKKEKFEKEQLEKGLVKYNEKWVPIKVFEKAQKAKGLIKYNGEWITQKEFARAQIAKGLVKYQGKWITFDKVQKAKGLIKYNGEWITQKELQDKKSTQLSRNIVDNVMKINSQFYNQKGFQEYSFGMKKNSSLFKKGKFKDNHPWADFYTKQKELRYIGKRYTERTQLYFIKNRLIGLKREYGSIDHYKLMIKKFGRLPKQYLKTYEHRMYLSQNSYVNGNGLRNIYNFPNVLVRCFIEEWPRSTHVQLEIYDRKTIVKKMYKNIKNKYTILKDIAEVVNKVNMGEINISGETKILPQYRNYKQKTIGNNTYIYHKDFDKHKIRKSAISFITFTSQVEVKPFYKKVYIDFTSSNFSKNISGFDDESSEIGLLFHDLIECNSIVTQHLFPPSGLTITEYGDRNKSYAWETKDQWNVKISQNNTISLKKETKTPKEKKKL